MSGARGESARLEAEAGGGGNGVRAEILHLAASATLTGHSQKNVGSDPIPC